MDIDPLSQTFVAAFKLQTFGKDELTLKDFALSFCLVDTPGDPELNRRIKKLQEYPGLWRPVLLDLPHLPPAN